MKNKFSPKLLQYLLLKKKDKGFTLIELLIISIIVGLLAAIALPKLLGQIGKAREVEGKNGIAAINKSQQAFHFEKQVFASSIFNLFRTTIEDTSNELGVAISSDYYNFSIYSVSSIPILQGNDLSVAYAISKDPINHGVRDYSGAVVYSSGQYNNIICQSDEIGELARVTFNNSGSSYEASCFLGTELK